MNRTPTRLPQMLSMKDAAARCCVSAKTVSRLVKSGDLRSHRVGRQIRIADEDLASFLAATRR